MRKIVFPILLFFSTFILIANSTISLTPNTQTICSTGNDSVSFSINTTAIPNNSQIVIYKNNDSIFNPYNNQGDSIGVINIDGNSSTNFLSNACPTILGIFIDACNQGIDEDANEYMVISSGNGFKVSNLGVDLPNSTGTGNGDINIGACSFASTFRQTYLDSLRTGFCNSSNLIFAGPSDSIPSNAIVIIFTGNGTSFGYNFSEYCQLGVPIYILQNNCFRATGAFANNADGNTCDINTASRFRLTRILNRGCADSLVYDRCGLPVFDATNINEGDGNFVIRIKNGTDTASVAKGSIKKDSLNKCNGVVNDSLLNNYKFTYKIPTSLCNDTTYIKSVVKPTNTTGQVISNTVNFYYACVDVSTNVTRKTICSGEQTGITISSTDPNATFSWTTTGGNNTTGESAGNGNTINQTLTLSEIAISDSVTYNITATDKGCTKTTQVKVIILKTPTKPNLGNDTVVCGAFTKTLSTGQNANWTRDGQSAGTNVANITVSQVGTYIATVSNQCGTASDTIIITQNNTPTKPNLGADLNICGTINQALNAGQLANWTRDGQSAGSNVANITATQVGIYIATVSNQCGTVSDTIAITQNNTPTKPNLGADLNICGTINQALNAGQLANWTRDGQSAGTNVANITASQAGTYIVTISNQCGTASDTIIITQNNTPTKPNLGADLNICGTINQALNAGQLANWTRDGQSAGTNVANITATQAGTYIVTISNQCGTASDTIIITQNNTPTKPNLGADLNICGTINQALNVGQLANWTRDGQNAGTNVENITVTQVGTYIATVSNQCGTVSDTIVISQENVSVQITGNTEVCNGSSVTLSVAGQYDSIRWSNGATTSSINVTVPNAYSVNVYRNGCSATAQTTVTECQQQICNPTILGDTIFCNGTSITLNAGAGFDSYAWNNGQSGQTITISQGGQFIVNVSGQNCTGADTINVRLINPPTTFNIGKDTSYCGTFTRTISTSNGEVATWSTGATATSITVNEAGTYTATISNQCGSEQAEITITQKALPTVDLRTDTTICTGASITLDATLENATYLWNTGAETATIEVSTEGTYSVTVTLDGCTSTDSKLVSVLNPPTTFNIGKDTSYCGTFTRTISTSNGEVATWSTGATATSITVNEAGTYTATISNQCGSEQASIVIFKNELPYVSLGKDTALCNDAIELSIGQNDFQSVLWSTQEIGNSITVENEGIYFVSVTDNNDCSNTDTINVGINCKNEVWVPNAFTPNGDNMNDVFYVRGNQKNVKVEKMIVFDRWGNKIFETGNILPDNKAFGWDGTYKGKKQQVEAYGYYVKVKYIDGSTQELKGNVTLLE